MVIALLLQKAQNGWYNELRNTERSVRHYIISTGRTIDKLSTPKHVATGKSMLPIKYFVLRGNNWETNRL